MPKVIPTGVSSGPPIVYHRRPQPGAALDARSAPAEGRGARARGAAPSSHASCSFRTPVCVHGSGADERAGAATLAAFESAWRILTGALDLPAPDLDPTTLAYDVFLTRDEAELGGSIASTFLEARDVRSAVDRGRAFSLVDARARPGCALDTAAATALARAVVFRVAPATEEGTARAQAAHFAELAVPCALGLAAADAATFQAYPERATCDAHAFDVAVAGGHDAPPSAASTRFAAGSAAFWARLDWAFGRSPGGIARAVLALHPTMTPVGAGRWINTPDTFDVLRASFRDALSRGSTIADLMLDFGVARAFFGAADDGLHLPSSRTWGDGARVPLDWDIAWPTAPRRLVPRVAVAPTGASYVAIRTQGARPNARLRVELDWEEHALFRWTLVKVDAQGRELGRVGIPAKERATSAQITLVDLAGVDRVLLVGVNVGDPAYAFDPDDEVWEPHAWVLTVAEE